MGEDYKEEKPTDLYRKDRTPITRKPRISAKAGGEGTGGGMRVASALLDEWTCSSVKLIKWESLACHLLSL